MTQLKEHPEAAIFPMLEGEEYDALVADIKENGLNNPVVLYEGKILDGRNRYKAALEAGVELKLTDFAPSKNGPDAPRRYVISENMRRRHLSPSQRWAINAKQYDGLVRRSAGTNQWSPPRGGARRPGIQDEAVAAGVSDETVNRGRQVEREAPELLPAIVAGELSLRAATVAIRERRTAKLDAEDVETAREIQKDRLGEWDGFVKDYLKALKALKTLTADATAPAGIAHFSPEGRKFTLRKLAGLRDAIDALRVVLE